jgi:Flp pilus assembly protein TadB
VSKDIEHRGEEHRGLSMFDGALIVGAGIIAVVVGFAVLGALASLVWTLIKVIVIVGLIVLVARLVFRRHS